jgi:hypothetical protein
MKSKKMMAEMRKKYSAPDKKKGAKKSGPKSERKY